MCVCVSMCLCVCVLVSNQVLFDSEFMCTTKIVKKRYVTCMHTLNMLVWSFQEFLDWMGNALTASR